MGTLAEEIQRRLTVTDADQAEFDRFVETNPTAFDRLQDQLITLIEQGHRLDPVTLAQEYQCSVRVITVFVKVFIQLLDLAKQDKIPGYQVTFRGHQLRAGAPLTEFILNLPDQDVGGA